MPSLNFFPLWILQLLCWLHLEAKFQVGYSHPNVVLLLPHESYCVLDFYLVLFHGPDHMLCLSWTSTEVPFGSIFLFFLRDDAIFSIMTSDSVTWASATRWCGLLIAYWALKHVISITNESMEFLNNQVYQWSVAPFNIIGNTRHMIALSFMDRLIHLCDECVDMLSGSESLP